VLDDELLKRKDEFMNEMEVGEEDISAIETEQILEIDAGCEPDIVKST
jgi:hypothetical protein